MPRWLFSLLVAIGFLALVAMALLPKNLTVIVDIDAQNAVERETINNYAAPVAINEGEITGETE